MNGSPRFCAQTLLLSLTCTLSYLTGTAFLTLGHDVLAPTVHCVLCRRVRGAGLAGQDTERHVLASSGPSAPLRVQLAMQFAMPTEEAAKWAHMKDALLGGVVVGRARPKLVSNCSMALPCPLCVVCCA